MESHHTMLVPGCYCPDEGMRVLHTRLNREGIETHNWRNDLMLYSPISFRTVLDYTLERLDRTLDTTGEKISIVGHSFGGLLAKYLLNERPDAVDKVIVLGAPINTRRILSDPLKFLSPIHLATTYAIQGDKSKSIREPAKKTIHSVYSLDDIVVPHSLSKKKNPNPQEIKEVNLGHGYDHVSLILDKKPAKEVSEIILSK